MAPNWYRWPVTRWMAEYRVDQAASRIDLVRIRPATIELVAGWVVTAPVAAIGTPSPGWEPRVSVLQDLGESPELTARQIRRMQPGQARILALEELQRLRAAPGWVTDFLGLNRSPASPAVTLAVTAARYVQAIEGGDRTPVSTVARELGLPQSRVRDRLYRARQQHLLEPLEPGRGRARGQLTERAIELLRTEATE